MQYSEIDIFKNSEDIVLFKKKGYEGPGYHTHEFLEIIYIYSGSCIQEVDSLSHYCERGSIIVVQPGQQHNAYNAENLTLIELLVKNDTAHEIMDNIYESAANINPGFCHQLKPFIDFAVEKRHKAESIFEDMITEYGNKGLNSHNILKSYLNILLTYLVRHDTDSHVTSKGIPADVIDYINIHFRKKFTLEEIAAKSYYSPKYFSFVFKKATGMTLSDYVAKKRVEEGCHLLMNTDMTVEEISKNLGWENSTRFYNHFKKLYGTTPHKYRKNKR